MNTKCNGTARHSSQTLSQHLQVWQRRIVSLRPARTKFQDSDSKTREKTRNDVMGIFTHSLTTERMSTVGGGGGDFHEEVLPTLWAPNFSNILHLPVFRNQRKSLLFLWWNFGDVPKEFTYSAAKIPKSFTYGKRYLWNLASFQTNDRMTRTPHTHYHTYLVY